MTPENARLDRWMAREAELLQRIDDLEKELAKLQGPEDAPAWHKGMPYAPGCDWCNR